MKRTFVILILPLTVGLHIARLLRSGVCAGRPRAKMGLSAVRSVRKTVALWICGIPRAQFAEWIPRVFGDAVFNPQTHLDRFAAACQCAVTSPRG